MPKQRADARYPKIIFVFLIRNQKLSTGSVRNLHLYMDDVTDVFVYGTLRSGLQHEAFTLLKHCFELKGQAKVSGILFDLGNYPGAVPAAGEAMMTGELYALKTSTHFAGAIALLDDYEGANPSENKPELYSRKMTEVWCEGKKSIAWIYWFAGATEGMKRIISGDIMEYIEQNKQLGWS